MVTPALEDKASGPSILANEQRQQARGREKWRKAKSVEQRKPLDRLGLLRWVNKKRGESRRCSNGKSVALKYTDQSLFEVPLW